MEMSGQHHRTAWVRARGLETVNLDGVLGNRLGNKELSNLLALVSLELDNVAKLGVFNYGTVAREFFLESLQKQLGIVLLGQSLECGDSLAAVALLDTDVDVLVLLGFLRFGSLVGRNVERCFTSVGEGI